MAFKQPKVPEYRAGEGKHGLEAFLRTLTLFLKDFCMEAWAAYRRQESMLEQMARRLKEIEREAGGE